MHLQVTKYFTAALFSLGPGSDRGRSCRRTNFNFQFLGLVLLAPDFAPAIAGPRLVRLLDSNGLDSLILDCLGAMRVAPGLVMPE